MRTLLTANCLRCSFSQVSTIAVVMSWIALSPKVGSKWARERG